MSIRRMVRLRARPADVNTGPPVDPPPPPPPPPPSGSAPIDLGTHPRIMVSTADLDGIASNLTSNATLRADLDTLVGQVAGTIAVPNSFDSTTGARDFRGWRILNASFLALLHTRLVALGYVFPASLDTPQKCAANAYARFETAWKPTFDANADWRVPWDTGSFTSAHGYMTSDIGTPGWVHLAVLWDWCKDYLEDSAQQALVTVFETYWNSWVEPAYITTGANANYPTGSLNEMIIQNQNAQSWEQAAFYCAFIGDAEVDATISDHADVYVRGFWRQIKAELSDFWTTGHWPYEGIGYAWEDIGDALWICNALQSAFGENVVGTRKFFTDYYRYVTSMLKLRTTDGLNRTALGHWGTMSTDGMLYPTMDLSFLVGNTIAEDDAVGAGLLKYVFDNHQSGDSNNWPLTNGAKVWGGAVRSYFIHGGGWTNVAAVNPQSVTSMKAQKHGWGAYVFRSGYTTDSTKVFFQANDYRAWGHHGGGYADWELYKQGNLILMLGPSGKSGAGATSPSHSTPQKSICHSNTYVKPVATQHMHFSPTPATTGWSHPPASAAESRFSNGYYVMSTSPIKGEKYDASAYGYVWYDGTPLYNGSAAGCTGYHTEFVYLAGANDHEFVVRLDRHIISNTSTYEKMMQLWVPVEPAYLDGAVVDSTADIPGTAGGSASRSRTVRTSTNVTKMSVTNQGVGVSHYGYSTGTRDAKLFLTFVHMPPDYQVRSSGGDYVEYQFHDFSFYQSLTVVSGRYPSAGYQNIFGWGRIQIDSQAAEDPFLVVGQIGLASTMSTQTDAVEVTSVDGNDLGAHIKDTSNEWLVMFAKGYAAANARRGATACTITPAGGTVKCLFANRFSNASYGVSYSGGTITIAGSGGTTVTASGQGVLEFTVTVSGAVITPGVS